MLMITVYMLLKSNLCMLYFWQITLLHVSFRHKWTKGTQFNQKWNLIYLRKCCTENHSLEILILLWLENSSCFLWEKPCAPGLPSKQVWTWLSSFISKMRLLTWICWWDRVEYIAGGAILENYISLLCFCYRVEAVGSGSVIHKGKLNLIHRKNLIEPPDILRKLVTY